MFIRSLQLCAAASLTAATNLFVSDYSGDVSTLSLTEHGGHYSLTKVSANTGCAPNPSWLTFDTNHATLYCLDEGLEVTNGSLTSFTIGDDGSLTKVHRETTISGPVSGVIYGNPAEKRSIALAHYSGSALSTWELDTNRTGDFAFEQDFLFNLTKPGPNAERQDAPHEHEAVLDPTGQFIVVPDLGADLVRIFSIDAETDKLTAEKPLAVLPGSGPRHVAFYQPYGVSGSRSTSFMFLVSELGNTITSFAISYPSAGGMSFKQVYNTTSYGDLVVPEGNAAAEIAISVSLDFHHHSMHQNTDTYVKKARQPLPHRLKPQQHLLRHSQPISPQHHLHPFRLIVNICSAKRWLAQAYPALACRRNVPKTLFAKQVG